MTKTEPMATTFLARDGLHSPGAAMGNLTAMSRSTDMAERYNPDNMPQVTINVSVTLKQEENYD
jgi:hypothetical protein